MTLSQEIRRVLSLAWPVFLVYLTTIGISAIDTIMVGQYSTAELAYLGVGRVLFWVVVVIITGLLSGIMVFSARADGAGEKWRCGGYWRQGVVYGMALALPGALLLAIGGEQILLWLGEPAEIAAQGHEYLLVMAVGMPAYVFTMATAQFLQGISRPRPAMVVMLAIWPVNIALNWLFIEGNMGAPALGATGAALATTLSQLCAGLAAWLYIRWMPQRDQFGIGGQWRDSWRGGAELRGFGIAPGLASGLEYAGFGGLSLLAGLINEVTVGAYQAVLMLHSLSFAAILGLASAAGVRVGNAMGRRDAPGVRRSVNVTVGFGLAAMAPFVLVFFLAPHIVVRIFSTDPEVLTLATTMMRLIALFIFADGLQFIWLYSLRAMGDQLMGSVLQIFSLFIVMLVAAWLAAFPLGLGGKGLAVGMNISLVAAALLLGGRYWWLSRRLKFYGPSS